MLTEKQEKFAVNVFNGMTLTDAYKDAYDCENSSDGTIYTEASLLKDNPKVTQRIKELRDAVARPHIMTAQERLEWLTSVIENTEESTKNRLSASDQMNKMQGEYVTKVVGNLDVKLEDLL